ncbi:MAG: hypothetical protein QGF94_00030 [Candidatus Thalassarchaeaceae archaeon]|nr:hypothetical protein [Candidatus Thalassarchaeaceae archaeon]
MEPGIKLDYILTREYGFVGDVTHSYAQGLQLESEFSKVEELQPAFDVIESHDAAQIFLMR